jgi:hypothetical protein
VVTRRNEALNFHDNGSRGDANGFCMTWRNSFHGAGMEASFCQIEVRRIRTESNIPNFRDMPVHHVLSKQRYVNASCESEDTQCAMDYPVENLSQLTFPSSSTSCDQVQNSLYFLNIHSSSLFSPDISTLHKHLSIQMRAPNLKAAQQHLGRPAHHSPSIWRGTRSRAAPSTRA